MEAYTERSSVFCHQRAANEFLSVKRVFPYEIQCRMQVIYDECFDMHGCASLGHKTQAWAGKVMGTVFGKQLVLLARTSLKPERNIATSTKVLLRFWKMVVVALCQARTVWRMW